MAAPLAPDFAESVLWQEQAPAHDGPGAERAAVRRPPRTCPTAPTWSWSGRATPGCPRPRELAAAGRDVLVLDAHPVGWGASTRNGGMVIPELTSGPAALERSLGPLGRRLYAEINEAFDHVEELTAGSAPLIACDYERTGQLYLAHAGAAGPGPAGQGPGARRRAGRGGAVRPPRRAGRRGRIARLPRRRRLRAHGRPPPRTVPPRPRGPGAGRRCPHRRRGARALDRPPGRQRGGAPRDSRARRRRHPRDRGRARSSCARTPTPTTPCRRSPGGCCRSAASSSPPRCSTPSWPDSVSPRGRMLVDSKNFLFYWRLTPDGRVVFGGRRSLARSSLAQAREFLYASMVAVHPQLAGVAVARAWGGDVAVTLDRLPHVGRIDGAWYATGCNGGGVALNTWLGMRIGQHLAGDGPPAGVRRAPAPAHPAAPLAPRVPPRRRPVLPLAGPRLPPLTPLAAHPRQPEAMGSTPRARGDWVPYPEPVPHPRPSGTHQPHGSGDSTGGMKRRASSIGPISPTSLPSGSATMA